VIPMQRPEQWTLLRTKTDETTDDPDWAGLNDSPTEPVGGAAILAEMPSCSNQHGRPYTGVEVFVLGVTDARVPQDRTGMTVDLQLVEVISRALPGLGGAIGDAAAVVDSSAVADVLLNRVVYFPINGASQFTIRITSDTNDAADNLQVWWRAVSR
jgi:hypothetical protein